MKLSFHLVIDFAHTKQDLVQRAFVGFFKGTDAAEHEEGGFPLFAEWLIFDFRQDSGVSFIAEYVLKNPDNLDDITLSHLKQAAETNKYGAFEIIGLKRSKWIDLEHLFSGNKFRVYDVSSSATIPEKGTIHARIGRIDGKWYFIGSNPFYFNNTFTDRMKKIMRENEDSTSFISPKDTWTMINAPKKTPPSLTQKEIEQKRIAIEKQYRTLAKKNKIELSFEKVTREIYEENNTPPLDMWEFIIKKGFPREVFVENMGLFQDIWNFFPHKEFSGNSPAEMFNRLKKAKQLGRNDPCWCGSGKKWKKCHYPNLPA